jgi:HEAT repeat protein
MTTFRLLGLIVAVLFMVAAVSAQPGVPPGGKMPPVLKPGNPPPKPGDPKPGNPKDKNPMLPGKQPGPGIPPVTLPGPAAPPKKKDNIKWPDKVNDKTLETTVKDMRTHADPGVREACIRALPLFGPKAREAGANELVDAMTKDLDWNVRLAAVGVAPIVLLGFAESPDQPLTNGINAIYNLLSSGQLHFKYEAVAAVAAMGPYIRKAKPGVREMLSSLARDQSSWHMRRAATAALGSIGQGLPSDEDPEKRNAPEMGAVTTLLEVLRIDNCAAVRREAVNALIGVGPVAATQQKAWRTTLDGVVSKEKDKSIVLWARVCIIRNSPDGLKGNEHHLDAIAKVLQAPEAAGRLEACQALGVLGEDGQGKLDDLIKIINNGGEEPIVVAAAIMAVAAMPDKSAVTVPILQQVMANHKNEDVKKVAKEAVDILSGNKKKN